MIQRNLKLRTNIKQSICVASHKDLRVAFCQEDGIGELVSWDCGNQLLLWQRRTCHHPMIPLWWINLEYLRVLLWYEFHSHHVQLSLERQGYVIP